MTPPHYTKYSCWTKKQKEKGRLDLAVELKSKRSRWTKKTKKQRDKVNQWITILNAMGGAGMVFFVKCWDRILFIHSFSFNHLQVGGAGMVFFEWGVEIEFCSSTHYLLFISRSSFPDVVVPFPDPDVVVAHLHFTIHFFLAFFWWYYISEWPFYLIFFACGHPLKPGFFAKNRSQLCRCTRLQEDFLVLNPRGDARFQRTPYQERQY